MTQHDPLIEQIFPLPMFFFLWQTVRLLFRKSMEDHPTDRQDVGSKDRGQTDHQAY